MFVLAIVLSLLAVFLFLPLYTWQQQYWTIVYRYGLRYQREALRKTPQGSRGNDALAPKYGKERTVFALQRQIPVCSIIYVAGLFCLLTWSDITIAARFAAATLPVLALEVVMIAYVVNSIEHAQTCLQVADMAWGNRTDMAIEFDMPEYCDQKIVAQLRLPPLMVEKCHKTMRSWDKFFTVEILPHQTSAVG